MDTIFKAFIGVFFSFLVTFLGVGVLSAAMDAQGAYRFLEDCGRRLEASNLSDEVAEACMDDAASRGYVLEVSAYGEGDRYGRATLTYEINVPILGMSQALEIGKDLT